MRALTAAVVAYSALLLAANGRVSGTPSIPAGLVAAWLCYLIGVREPARRGLPWVALLIATAQLGAGFSEFPNVEIGFVTLAPWWAGREVRRRRALVAELGVRSHELAAEEDTFVRLAVQRERARIARELHDIVSHHVAVMVIQAGAGRLAAGAADTSERMTTIRQSGELALADMARLVALLGSAQEDERTGVRELARLLADARDVGPHVRVDAPALDTGLPPATVDVAYRVVQEALTNAMKHAPGCALEISARVAGEDLVIRVRNALTRSCSALAPTGSGLGLVGMRERVDTLGGALNAGPDADGWVIEARLPVRAVETLPTAT